MKYLVHTLITMVSVALFGSTNDQSGNIHLSSATADTTTITQVTTSRIIGYTPFGSLIRETSTIITASSPLPISYWEPEEDGVIKSYTYEGGNCTINKEKTRIDCSQPITKIQFTYSNQLVLSKQGSTIQVHMYNFLSFPSSTVSRSFELTYPSTLLIKNSTIPPTSNEADRIKWEQTNSPDFDTTITLSDPNIHDVFVPSISR